ncbi:hypothetical protein L2750_14135 [Shewanella submarina]|uniref:SnoaL-like domain-containing protein n=1 Tax=Shewanella submarina TaxID=2016376 RepID=A0ABV7GI25_9GAMM|nr:hypothetical protein [Shewanella submarina]MCL1038275.1 hypothetical protein [Shewanella submarina]
MEERRKQGIIALLKGIETGEPESVAVVNEQQYIQHNPLTREGDVGLAELFARLAKTNPRVSIIRIFADGDFIFAHTEYDFSSEKICFEVFRFDGDQAVEHWDNLQLKQPANLSGHTMTDGETRVQDKHLTETNRQHVSDFIQTVMINRQFNQLSSFIAPAKYIEHNPQLEDNLSVLETHLARQSDKGDALTEYRQLHRTFAEGNFVLTQCEGQKLGYPTAFYDLFRLDNGKIVEHWDTTETIPPRSDWVNQNGKF